MTDKPIIITKRTKRTEQPQADLGFVPEYNDELPFLRAYRQNAWKTYQSVPLPKGTEEEWRRTSLKEIDFSDFSLVISKGLTDLGFPKQLSEPVAGEKNGGQLLLSPHGSHLLIDEDLLKKGVVFDSLKNLVSTHAELLSRILARIDHGSGKFSSLAGALEFNGVLLYVPRNVQIQLPLQSVYWVTDEGAAHSIHVLIYLEEGAQATYVHESTSPEQAKMASLHAGLMEIYVGPGAHLNFVELQSWGENVINFTRENVVVDRDGSIDWIFGALGSRLTKNFSNLDLIGKGSTGKMSGFYFTDNNQHLDHDTQQNHLAPNTTSDLLFKGALTDKSRSVWQGMIYVAPEASKTDGYQANRNLVLSKEARADSIPGLEILTDDVRCTHGATVGKIDNEQIFYLESRGLPRETAQRLIVEGFFDPIMQRIPFEGVRNRFQQAIKEKMEHIG